MTRADWQISKVKRRMQRRREWVMLKYAAEYFIKGAIIVAIAVLAMLEI